MKALKQTLKEVAEQGATLSRNEARHLLTEILASEPGDVDLEIAGLLAAFATRGETVEELTGFAEAMRSRSLPISLTDEERAALVDTCGTGGDGLGTFNISTGAALVAVAAGAKVAKHGNRAVTSYCGSADVLEAMGIPVALGPEQAVDCLRTTGFMFLYAPALHPALKRVQGIRRALGFRTIFNLAGPLTNPAGAPAQVMGVYSGARVSLVAETMARLGVRRAFVVHGLDGLDELTLCDESSVAEVRKAVSWDQGTGCSVRLFRISPEEAGLQRSTLAELRGPHTAQENAALLDRIFGGEPGPKRDVVLLNAAAALMAAGIAGDLKEGVARGAEAIDCGGVAGVVGKLREFARSLAAVR
ncbi:MAG: anthranilate phosphoribosyltransferase [Silvibacterium sp.]|nr:anthranilate phosphoribosyltransferase [Silvibacterium sp.]